MATTLGLGAQDSTATLEIDPSKPTNFYTQINVAAEVSWGVLPTLLGARVNGQYSINASNLVLFELPYMANLENNRSGIGDVRLRYFNIAFKDYSKVFPKVAALAPSIDIYMPTGSVAKGLGAGSWTLAPCIVWGWFINAKIQAFPIISYQYISKPNSDKVPDALRFERHGLTFQSVCNYSFTKRTFLQLTPIYAINDLKRGGSNGFTTEVKLSHMPTARSKVQLFWRELFTLEQHTVNLGYTFYS
ncbi:hypothetical protein BUE76_16895 [Cnuella takakiae]|nr:hypothetical protein BUE76_16895 [Cnuella takakiae]